MAVNDSFPLFLTLPTELRFKIWSIAFSDPVVVGFLSHMDNMGLCQAGGRPIISPDHSSVAQTCKEAWRLMSKARYRVEFAAALDPSPLFATWIDFSKTIFYLGHGHFSRTCIAALNAISAHVQDVAIVWSTYRELIETCKRLPVFLALRRVIILIAQSQDLADFRRFLGTGIDLNCSNLRVQGPKPGMNPLDPSVYVGAPQMDTKHLRFLVDEFLRLQVQQIGQQLPILEVVALPCI